MLLSMNFVCTLSTSLFLIGCFLGNAAEITDINQLKETQSSSTSGYRNDMKPGCIYDTTDIIKMIVLKNESDYNKNRVPKQFGQRVDIQVWVQEVSSISEITQDFVIDLYMNEIWQDPKLSYEHLNICRSNVSVDHTVYDRIWTPNTCFINSKTAIIHESPFRNVFLMIFPNGTLWANYRLKLTGPCQMRLQKFPMDSQTCSLTFESFNYNNEEVQMRWFEKDPILILAEGGKVELPDFTMTDHIAHIQAALYPAGYWDELTMMFIFKRRYVWYILQAYIPTYLTVFISWISFYLGARSIPARTMIGVNSLLAMTFQFGTIFRNLPKVSYVKAIDVWMLSGMTFVFASLIELAIVGFLSSKQDQKNDVRNRRKRIQDSSPAWDNRLPSAVVPNTSDACAITPYCSRSSANMQLPTSCAASRRYRYRAIEKRSQLDVCGDCMCSMACMCATCKMWSPERIDRFSAVAFPTLFTVFNIFYWGYYTRS